MDFLLRTKLHLQVVVVTLRRILRIRRFLYAMLLSKFDSLEVVSEQHTPISTGKAVRDGPSQ